jgi:hypothetical protein
MKRKLVSFALVSCFAGLLGVAPASADDAHLVAYLSGANERPNAAPAENIGRAVVTITGYHIHLGAANAAGPVVVPFAAPTGSQNYQCVTSENEALLDNIAANPGQYYVNIHNAAYPGGAARGQLQAF